MTLIGGDITPLQLKRQYVCACVCVYVCVYVCVCVCFVMIIKKVFNVGDSVYVSTLGYHRYSNIFGLFIYIYIYIYICVCVCVCK